MPVFGNREAYWQLQILQRRAKLLKRRVSKKAL
jgi:hypothetical protein